MIKRNKNERMSEMIAHGKDIKIFSGNSNRPLAEAICKEMGMELGNA